MMAAIALMYMLWHHLFAFPNRLLPGSDYQTIFGDHAYALLREVADFGNICVPIFAFISGYALSKNWDSFASYKKVGIRALKFLTGYWIVFGIILLVGIANSDQLPSLRDTSSIMIGLKVGAFPYINPTHAWYVVFYLLFLLFSPLLVALFRVRRTLLQDLIICLLLFVLIRVFYSPYGAPFLALIFGMLFGKYDWLDVLHRHVLCHIPAVILMLIIIITTMLGNTVRFMILLMFSDILNGDLSLETREYIMYFVYAIYAMVLIICFGELLHRLRVRMVKQILFLIGNLSMFIWFLHGIMQSGKHYGEKFIYSPREPILIFLLLLICVLPAAWACQWLHIKLWQLPQILSRMPASKK